MTQEEAILLSAYTGYLLAPDFADVHKFCEETLGRPIWTHEFADSDVQKEIQEKLRPQIMELVQNIAALRPTSREQVEKVWRGEWIWNTSGLYPKPVCSKCGEEPYRRSNHTSDLPNYCPKCGRPMTDEAVQMVMEKMEALHGET